MFNNEDYNEIENKIKSLNKPVLNKDKKDQILQALHDELREPKEKSIPLKKISITLATVAALLVLGFLTYITLNNNEVYEQASVTDMIDAIVLDGVSYEANYEADSSNLEKGSKITEVKFQVQENVEQGNYKLKDGDATLLPIGTEIYDVVGYDSSFRVMANNQLYEAYMNENAKTVAELYPINDKVEKISIISTEDGSHIKEFSNESTALFLNEFFNLKYVKPMAIHEKGLDEGERVFLKLHYLDGTSTRILYWKDTNAFHFGAEGSNLIKEIVEKEISGDINNQNNKVLELTEQTFDPSLIEFYTGIPSKFEVYSIEDVKNDVYVHGVITHSGIQSISIYSKINLNHTQNITAILENNVIKIYVAEKEANIPKEHVVYYTSTKEKPETIEVYRNGELESTKDLIYGIE